MSELTYTVSMPFIRKGKEALKDMEFVMALSMDLKWFTPDHRGQRHTRCDREQSDGR